MVSSSGSAYAGASRGPGLVAFIVIFTTVTFLCIGARLYRCVKTRRFGLEDGMVVLAVLLSFAVSGIFSAIITLGYGKHITQVPSENLLKVVYTSFLVYPISCWAFLLSKLALGTTLLRLGFGRTFQVLVYIIMTLAVVFNVWPSIAGIVGCNQWKYQINQSLACDRRNQLSLIPLLYIAGGANTAIDFAYVVLIETYLRRVKLHPRDRFAIRVVLVCMLGATVCCIVRMTYYPKILSADTTHYGVPSAQLGIADVNLALWAACLPAVRQLLGRHFPKHIRFWRVSNQAGTYGSTHASRTHTQGKASSRWWKSAGRGDQSGFVSSEVHTRINKVETVEIGHEMQETPTKDIFHDPVDGEKNGSLGVVCEVEGNAV